MYDITIAKKAEKYILRLDRPTAKRIRDAIDVIAADPTSGEALTNHESEYKYRVGDYRILYDVYETTKIVAIVKVAGRGDVYKN
ncbi:MAG: type II toxin-antitoxin system RelE/ParE family toxin [Ferruginibacter sp.]|nr:type II toxin-antitoxin system RelE/ParE family toxin [Ferruginibacter sp.]